MVDHDTRDPADNTLFNLTVQQVATSGTERRIVASESFRNVSVTATDARFLPSVLKRGSTLVRVSKNPSAPPPWLIGTQRPFDTLSSLPSSSLPSGPAFVKFDQSGNDGAAAGPNDYIGSSSLKTGISALDNADLFNLLCIPPPSRGGDTDPTVWAAAAKY